jgi:hypothetical protein
MTMANLKYNPYGYKKLAEVSNWLAHGNKVEVKGTDGKWRIFKPEMGFVEWLLQYKCEFRIRETK